MALLTLTLLALAAGVIASPSNPSASCYVTISNNTETCTYHPPNGYTCGGTNTNGLPSCTSIGICYIPMAGNQEVCYYTPPYGYDCYFELIPEVIANLTHCDNIKANAAPEITFASGSTSTNEDTVILIPQIQINDADARNSDAEGRGYVRVTFTASNGVVKFDPTLIVGNPAAQADASFVLSHSKEAGGMEFLTGNNLGGSLISFQARMDPLVKVMKSLTYTPASNKNSAIIPKLKFQIVVNVNDQGNTGGTAESDEKIFTMNVVAINDPPVITMAALTASLEDTPRLLSGLSITDVDADESSSNNVLIIGKLTVNLTVTKGILWVNAPSGADGSSLSPGTATTQANGARTLIIFTSVAQLSAILPTLSYKPNIDENDDTGSGPEQLLISANDHGYSGASSGTTVSTASRTIPVTPVNDWPVIHGPANVSCDEDISSKIGVSFTVSDVDSFTGLSLNLSVQYGKLQTTLIGFAQGPGNLIFTGLTQQNINDILADVSYLSNKDFNGLDNFTIGVDDGSGTSTSRTIEYVNLNVEPVNDPPYIAHTCPSACALGGYTGSIVVALSATATFDGSSNGTPKFNVSDVDSDPSEVQVLLEVNHGLIILNPSTDFTKLRFTLPSDYATNYVASGTDVILFMATKGNANTALNGMQFKRTSSGTDSLIFAVNDLQHNGKGRAETDFVIRTIN